MDVRDRSILGVVSFSNCSNLTPIAIASPSGFTLGTREALYEAARQRIAEKIITMSNNDEKLRDQNQGAGNGAERGRSRERPTCIRKAPLSVLASMAFRLAGYRAPRGT